LRVILKRKGNRQTSGKHTHDNKKKKERKFELLLSGKKLKEMFKDENEIYRARKRRKDQSFPVDYTEKNFLGKILNFCFNFSIKFKSFSK
jgi:hypothetical protein